MIGKLFKIFFIVTQVNDPKTLFYRMATVNGEKGCIQALLSEKMEKWWTVSACFNEIDTLRDKYSNENDQEKLNFLDELNNFIMSIQKKYENV